jgi:hypothetical protein
LPLLDLKLELLDDVVELRLELDPPPLLLFPLPPLELRPELELLLRLPELELCDDEEE